MSRRVAIDGRALQYTPLAGVGRGLANMLPSLMARVDVELITNAALPPPVDTNAVTRAVGVPVTSLTLPWMQIAVPRALRGYDGIFHGTFNVLPFWQPVPMVVTIHDLSFEHHPHLFPRRVNMLAFRYQARHAARTAAAVITVSQFIRDEIIAVYGVAPGKVLVAPNSVAADFGRLSGGHVDERLSALGVVRPYVAAFGGALRRRLDVSLAAWRIAKDAGHDVDLIVIGEPSLAPEPGLIVVGNCPDADYEALLTGAQAFLYPSEYEGFGMPALEALAAGVPLLCAPVASLPEVVGSAAAWCEEISGKAFGAVLSNLLGDSARLAELRVAGRARAAAAPTWADAADVVLKGYEIAGLSV